MTIPTDVFSGRSQARFSALPAAVEKLSKNPFLNPYLAANWKNPWRDNFLVSCSQTHPHSKGNVVESCKDHKAAGKTAVVVRTGILQNPAVAMGSQSHQSSISVARLLE